MAVVTNPKVFHPASGYEQAPVQTDAWLASPQAQVLHGGSQHWRIRSNVRRKAKLQGGNFTRHA